MAIKNRTDLKSYFIKNAIPTEGNFADLIDSQINQAQDGVFKPDGEPFSLVSAGGTQKRVLRLYSNYPSANPDWLISLNPLQDPANPATSRPGLGVTDGAGNTRLYIDPASGNIGVGTNNPVDKVSVVEGDVLIGGGRYRRLKIVSDKYWAGIELVAREKGEAGNPHIDFTHGELDNPNFGVRVYAPTNNALSVGALTGDASFDVVGQISSKGLIIESPVAHIDRDGAFYRNTDGQVYITVDDHLYFRKAGTGASWAAHVDTNSGTINLKGNINAAAAEITGTAFLKGGVNVEGAVAHVEKDGAFYRNTDGQVYITVDDHLYFRKANTGATWGLHMETGSGALDMKGLLSASGGSRFTNDRHWFQDAEKAGRVRVGAAWGIPGFYSEDGQDMTVGCTTNKAIYLGNPDQWVRAQYGEIYGAGAKLWCRGTGDEQVYIGGDGAGNDAQIGSMKAGISTLSVWNWATGWMDISFRTYHQFSDARAKRDIEPITKALDKVLRLRPVSYRWKEGQVAAESREPELGLLAQEVQEVVPEAVAKVRGDSFAISYSSITALLIGAVKELQKQIDDLRAELRPGTRK